MTISSEIKAFLNLKVEEFNQPSFIEADPISVPHRFRKKEDIEISAFLAATISWGNRKQIVKSAGKMIDLMGSSPFDFVMNYNPRHKAILDDFVHRTFNVQDFDYFLVSLRNIYSHHNGLEAIFNKYAEKDTLQPAIHHFRNIFLELEPETRSSKHVSDPLAGSAAKRINMWLRWLIRNDDKGVDFGIWKSLSPAQLSCPLDVHSGNMARKFGLLTRTQNDAKALAELDQNLRLLDPNDPVKYDFALFGLGAIEKL